MTDDLTIIIGANRGIGLELCKAFRSDGRALIGTTRTPSTDLEHVVSEVWDDIDVRADDLEEKLLNRLSGRRIERLILSAGILESDGLETSSTSAIRRQFEVNALGALRCAFALHPKVKTHGIIAFITSRMGSISDNTSGGYYGYRISKAALNAGAKSLALDLKPREISVAILHPGFVKTDMTGGQGLIDASSSAAMLKEQITAWKFEETGHFKHANGERLPW